MSKKAANKRGYGSQQDAADHRDHLQAASIVHLVKLPTRAGLMIFGQSA
jgi:hypothetical protein